MRPTRVVVALGLLGSMGVARDARAASAALTIELLDTEPVGLRVWQASGAKSPCSLVPIAMLHDGVLEKGKTLTILSDAARLCVAQTYAPFVKVGFEPAMVIHHVVGTLPVQLRLRSRASLLAPPPVFPTSPLVVSVEGTERIGVRISAGTTAPCDSKANAPLFSGVLEPDFDVSLTTDAVCVCFEQTHAPFVSSGWTPSNIRCRPNKCVGKDCRIDLTQPFSLRLPSRAP